ncbi:unnamed protein product, partial [Rangifer tarandus platyrhynchus]
MTMLVSGGVRTWCNDPACGPWRSLETHVFHTEPRAVRRPDGPGHWGIRAAELQLLESPASAGCWQSKAEPVAHQGAGGLYL